LTAAARSAAALWTIAGALAAPASLAAAELPAAVTPSEASDCSRALRWVNATGGPITVDVDGVGPRVLAAGRSARTCAPGEVVRYRVSAGGWRYRAQVEVAPRVTRTIRVRPPGGTIAVHNRLTEGVAVEVDRGEAVEIGAGRTVVIGPFEPGERDVAVRALGRAWAFGATVKVGAGRVTDLRLPRPTGRVRVTNPFAETAELAVGGRAFGDVAARAEVWVAGLGPGRHPVRWRARSGATVLQEALAGDLSAPRPATMEVEVDNRTGEDLDLPAALAAIGTALPRRACATWTLARADVRLRATGRESGLDYWFDARAGAATPRRWVVARPTALLRVDNRAGEPARLQVAGVDSGSLPAGASIGLRVPAGRLHLRADLPGRTDPQRAGTFLAAGEHGRWTIAARETNVTIASSWPDPLEVRFDSRRLGPLAARGELRVPVAPGDHDIEVRQPRIGWAESASVMVRDGERRTIAFAPPGAAIRVDNRHGDGDVVIAVDGASAATAAAGGSALIEADAGVRYAEVRSGDGSRRVTATVRAAPTEQVQVAAPPRARVALTITALAPCSIAIDGGAPRALAAGARWDVGEVDAGPHLVAVDQGGRHLRAQVDVDGARRAVRWVIRRPSPAGVARD